MTKDQTIFGLGVPAPEYFSGDAWVNLFNIKPEFDCMIYNVTFDQGVRNQWHKHAKGQILLCIDGEGYYQERGQKARKLSPGDVINIPAEAEHWHGAAPNVQFTHIGVTPRASENIVSWCGSVSDEDYEAATTD